VVDIFLGKYDAGGNFQWVRTWGGAGTDDAGGMVAADGAGHVYVAGRFGCSACNFDATHATQDPRTTNGSLDVFISAYDSNGNYLWAQTWGGIGLDQAAGMDVDRLGDVFVSGRFQNTADFDPSSGGTDSHTSNGGYDAFLSEFSASGTFKGAGSWGGSGDEMSGVTVDGANTVSANGLFASTVDFDPSSGGTDSRLANGPQNAFVSRFAVETPVSSGSGATITLTTDVTTTLSFGPVASPITVTTSLTNTQPVSPGETAMGPAFIVSAYDNTGATVTDLAQPFTLTVHFTVWNTLGLHGDTLHLCDWDAQAGVWRGVPTTVDPVNYTLTAQVSRLGMFAILGSPMPGVYLPLIAR
jgi:hypothetical protein